MKKFSLNKGFSLIELMVVVAIIAVLAAVGMVSYRSANERARDSRRQADLQQIASALEMYRTDEGEYPAALGDLVTGNYMREVPVDPSGISYVYPGTATPSDGEYNLCALMETQDGTVDGCGDSACGGVACNFRIQNPL